MDVDSRMADDTTGLSQAAAQIDLSGSDGDANMGLPQAAARSNLSGGAWDAMFAEVLENHALNHFELIQACNTTGEQNGVIKLHSQISGWGPLESTLRALGYRADSEDHWLCLGLGKDHGPDPSLQQVSQRVEFAQFLLLVAEDVGWSPGDKIKASKVSTRLTEAGAKCVLELGATLRRRQKRKPQEVPRWMEIDHSFLDYLHSISPQAKIALQLSEVHGPYAGGDFSMVVSEARHLHSELAFGPGRGVTALQSLPQGEYVIWALPEAEAWQRTVAAFNKYAEDPRASNLLSIVIPFEVPSGCETLQDIQDLWRHPLLGGKWDHIICSRKVFLDPVALVSTGDTGPSTQLKSLYCVTLSPKGLAPGLTPAPRIIKWKPVMAEQHIGPVIIVDFPASSLLQIRQALTAWNSLCSVRWDHHTKSPGSVGHSRRLILKGFLQQTNMSVIKARLTTESLQKHMHDQGCLIGLRNICQDPYSLLLELTSAAAAQEIQKFCSDVLLLSNNMALIRTEVSHQTWAKILSDIMRESPSCCPLQVKWRPSQHGGRTWAQPDITTKQLQAVRAQAKVHLQGRVPGSSPSDFATNLQLQGSLGPDPHALLRSVMSSVAQHIQANLREVDTRVTMQVGDWVMLSRPGTDEPSGSIRIQLSSVEQARHLQQGIQGNVVVVGGERIAIQVSNPVLMNLPTQLGN